MAVSTFPCFVSSKPTVAEATADKVFPSGPAHTREQAGSAFESSMRYGSAVLFGTFQPLDGDDKRQALDAITNRLIPGRVTEVRTPNPKEYAATLVLALPIVEWSLKVSDGWPDDPAADGAPIHR